jgi:hypothetical protein
MAASVGKKPRILTQLGPARVRAYDHASPIRRRPAMSNELRRKLHELQELSNNAPDPQTRAIIEALRLQTAILNERLFAIELQLAELSKGGLPQPEP